MRILQPLIYPAQCSCIYLPYICCQLPDVFLLSCVVYAKGRGTVVTGRVEQGIIKVGEEIEILGLKQVHMEVKHVLPCHVNDVMLYGICFCIYQSLCTEWTCEDYCNWCGNVQENFGSRGSK